MSKIDQDFKGNNDGLSAEASIANPYMNTLSMGCAKRKDLKHGLIMHVYLNCRMKTWVGPINPHGRPNSPSRNLFEFFLAECCLSAFYSD